MRLGGRRPWKLRNKIVIFGELLSILNINGCHDSASLLWKVIIDYIRHNHWENSLKLIVMLRTICYHLYNLENMENTLGGVLLLVKLQAPASNFAKSNTPPWVYFGVFYILHMVPNHAERFNLTCLVFVNLRLEFRISDDRYQNLSGYVVGFL